MIPVGRLDHVQVVLDHHDPMIDMGPEGGDEEAK